MRVGVDIDETIVYMCQDILDVINERNGTKYVLDDIYRYKMEKYLNVPESEVDLAVTSAILGNPEPIEFAIPVIKWLENHADIWFVTKRKLEITEPKHTRGQLDALGLHHPLIMDRNKTEVAKELELDYLIEDRAKILVDVTEKTDCIGILLDKPWNRHIEDSPKIIRVQNWKSILIFLLKELKKVNV